GVSRSTSARSTPRRCDHSLQTRSTTASESTSVPSMSSRTAARITVLMERCCLGDTLSHMQRWRGTHAAPGGWGRAVVTIGVFDGVHKGHQQIIGHTVKRAGELGVQSVVVTFDPHPSEVVRPGTHPAILTGQARKAELIEALGVDVLCVI